MPQPVAEEAFNLLLKNLLLLSQKIVSAVEEPAQDLNMDVISEDLSLDDEDDTQGQFKYYLRYIFFVC